ncbi:MAG: polysaccharide biosynthesis protein [Planctomycetes bacterium]|nr:polysaccharide biosynthesis protein [Planctomycetota bacterium]
MPHKALDSNPATPFSRDLSGANIARRVVLIGTPDTLATLAPQFALGSGLATPIGVVPIEDSASPHANACGLPLIASLEDLAAIHRRDPVSLAVVSVPKRLSGNRQRILTRLRELGIAHRLVTPLADLMDAPAERAQGPIDLGELIGRSPHTIDRDAVAQAISGKRIVVTGAGGSIGSELCRILAEFQPACIVMMERGENALFEIDRCLAERFPSVPRRAVLHDITDAEQTLRHFVNIRPQAVFHAAAHKHVPLMEDHPSHAVHNNFFGTRSVADAALAVSAERLVVISSDKAVNPTSVMGATKRLAEMYVQLLSPTAGRTTLSMVRFGNVLGSACSVLPIWERQLAAGGPLTVTDARMTRYFMSIREAAALVIQAGVIDGIGQPPSIYVLDMGEPIRILDLAERFARLHGYSPFINAAPANSEEPTVEISITGARPGEKLHEELAYAAEALSPTRFPGIRALRSATQPHIDAATLTAELSAVRTATDKGLVLGVIRRHVPEMRRPSDALTLGVEAAEQTFGEQIPVAQAA